MSSVTGSARRDTGERRGWMTMAVGTSICVLMWIGFAAYDPTTVSAMGSSTGGLTGGAPNPGYRITWEDTSGSCVSEGPGGTPSHTWPYPTSGSSVSSASYSYSQVSGGYSGIPQPTGPGTVDCSGTITATFTWDDDDESKVVPPPSVVVLHEYAVGYGVGESRDADSGITATGGYEDDLSKLVEGERYVVIEDPGDEFQRSVEPWAEGYVANPPESILMNAFAGVGYEVQVHEIRVDYAGVLDPDTAPKAMIGHAIRGTVNLDGLSNSGATFAWTITGQGQFESYSIGSAPDTTFATNAQTVLLAYYKPNATAQYSCSVNLATPDLAAFTVDGLNVEISEPSAGMTVDGGTVAFDNTYLLLGASGASFTVPNTSEYKSAYRGQTGDFGIVWESTAALTGAHATADAGKSGDARAHVCYVNTLTKVYRRRQKNNGTWDPCPDNFTGATKLDKQFPYCEISDDGKFPVTAGTTKAETDGPYIPVDNAYHKGVEMDDDHEVFFMFLPYDNGVGRYYVALTSRTWNPHGLATRSGSTWTLSSGGITLGTSVDNPSQPVWSSTLTGSSWPF